MMASHLYRDTVLMCGDKGSCLLKNDNPLSGFKGTWTTSLVKLLAPQKSKSQSKSKSPIVTLGTGTVELPPGAGAAAWVCADGISKSPCASWATVLTANGCAPDGSDCVLDILLQDEKGAVADAHVDLLTVPANMSLPCAAVTSSVAKAPQLDGSVDVTLSTNATALLVTLTTTEQGVWSDNAFALYPGSERVLKLRPIAGATPIDTKALSKALRVEHAGMYLGCNLATS
jgi:hypothetical protein